MKLGRSIATIFSHLCDLFAKRKNRYCPSRLKVSAQLLYKSILCLSRLPLCSEVVKFSYNDKRRGVVRGNGLEKLKAVFWPQADVSRLL